MERRTIIAIILIGLLYIIWFQYLNRLSPPQKENIESDRHQQDEIFLEHDQESDTLSKELYKEGLLNHSVLSAVDTFDTIEVPRKLIIDTDLYRAVLSTRGGTIQSWRLKSFEGVDNVGASGVYTHVWLPAGASSRLNSSMGSRWAGN